MEMGGSQDGEELVDQSGEDSLLGEGEGNEGKSLQLLFKERGMNDLIWNVAKLPQKRTWKEIRLILEKEKQWIGKKASLAQVIQKLERKRCCKKPRGEKGQMSYNLTKTFDDALGRDS